MADRDAILEYLSELLGTSAWEDYGPNGLQVVGSESVTHVASGVSSNAALFEQAAADNAELILVHHGLFWRNTPQPIDHIMKNRLKLLFDNNISLAAYHLPLDAHREHGNNALIATGLGMSLTDEAFAVMEGKSVGVVAEYDAPIDFADFHNRLNDLTHREPLHLGARPKSIRRVAVCSGGAQSELGNAAALGVDAFVTGEAGEPSHAHAIEAGVAFFSAGHYATETFGVRRLGELIAKKFDVEHSFHLLPTPV